jgi:hypothetical protein
MTGYLFALAGMVSIGSIGLLSKLAERRGCSPHAIALAVLAFWVFLYGLRFGPITTS